MESANQDRPGALNGSEGHFHAAPKPRQPPEPVERAQSNAEACRYFRPAFRSHSVPPELMGVATPDGRPAGQRTETLARKRGSTPEYENRYCRNVMSTSLPSSNVAMEYASRHRSYDPRSATLSATVEAKAACHYEMTPRMRAGAGDGEDRVRHSVPSLESELVCRFDHPKQRPSFTESEDRVRKSQPSLEAKVVSRYESIKSVARKASRPYATSSAPSTKSVGSAAAKDAQPMTYAQRRMALCDPRFTQFPTPCKESKEACRHFDGAKKQGVAAAHLAGAGAGGSAVVAASARYSVRTLDAEPPTSRQAAAETAALVAAQRHQSLHRSASEDVARGERAAGTSTHVTSMAGMPKTLREHMVEGNGSCFLGVAISASARSDRSCGTGRRSARLGSPPPV